MNRQSTGIVKSTYTLIMDKSHYTFVTHTLLYNTKREALMKTMDTG